MTPCVPLEEIANATVDKEERPQERHHEETHGGKDWRRPVWRNKLRSWLLHNTSYPTKKGSTPEVLAVPRAHLMDGRELEVRASLRRSQKRSG